MHGANSTGKTHWSGKSRSIQLAAAAKSHLLDRGIMISRKCYICKQTKVLTDFSKDRTKNRGYSYRCRPCDSNRPDRLSPELKAIYEKSEHGRERRNQASKTAYKVHRHKWQARAKLRYAVMLGKIVKPDHCEKVNLINPECNGKIQAHHYLGYEGVHWADVNWLCPAHHANQHKIMKMKFREKEVLVTKTVL